MPRIQITCAGCGRSLLAESEDAGILLLVPCPDCGSKTLNVEALSDRRGGVVKWKLQGRHGRLGEARPYVEASQSMELHRATGEWRQVDRVIDRDGDVYIERITHSATRKVIKDVQEPLTEHQGHGTAKRKPEK